MEGSEYKGAHSVEATGLLLASDNIVDPFARAKAIVSAPAIVETAASAFVFFIKNTQLKW